MGHGIAVVVSAIVVAVACACTAEDSPPTHLLDGSEAQRVTVELEGVEWPTVLTKSRLVRGDNVVAGSPADACLRGWAPDTHLTSQIVERVGVITESVTIRAGSSLQGCDNTQGPRERNRRWCGTSFGMLYGGYLRDPRLDILCTTADGLPVGFVWVEPNRRSRYVVVRQHGFAEVYESTGGLPVRLATTEGVNDEDSRVSVDVSEHDVRGRLIRRYMLEARVAG